MTNIALLDIFMINHFLEIYNSEKEEKEDGNN